MSSSRSSSGNSSGRRSSRSATRCTCSTPSPGCPTWSRRQRGVRDRGDDGARFKHPQRTGEAAAHRAFYESNGWRYVAATQTNEGEGDFTYPPGAHGGVALAGYGFRTESAAHAEAQDVLGRPVISLCLVDSRFYHLDTALAPLDDHNVAYYPDAFSESSRRVLRQLFPDAVLADAVDAHAFGLYLVSDGGNVFVDGDATGVAAKVGAAGYNPVPIELSELKKGGGSVKCCIAELRA